MLSWFDEPVELLRQAVRSAAVICDRIVAADGAFWFVHDKKASSPKRQKLVISEEAKRCGLKPVFLPPRIWEGQVTKRDAVLQEAMKGSDWVMTLDADWKIHGDRTKIRFELEAMLDEGIDQVAVNFTQPDNPERSWEEKAANEWHVKQTGQHFKMPFIYRVQPELHYKKNHWSLFGVNEAGAKIGLFGAMGAYAHVLPKTGTLSSEHCFEHLCLFREPKQIERNRDYINKRDLEVERVGFET